MLEKYQLPNGLNVILYPSHKSPVVTVQAWVRTGSADEHRGEEGISHFIEHLVFKGTRKFGVGEIASLIEGCGGELNAYTSFDQTVFHITLSKEFTHTAVDALSEMMGHPQFDAKEIDNEREVVIEEIKRSQDSPHREASQLLFSTVYQKHPYGIPVIGFEKNIRKFPRKKILNYYNTRYSPKNMSLVIVGDFDRSNIKKSLTETFGQISEHKVRPSRRPKEPVQKSPRVITKEAKFQETLVHLAWRIPNVKHSDTPAIDILAMILGQGDSSRLVQSCRLEQPLVNSVSAYAYTPQDEGFFGVSAGLSIEDLEEFLNVVGSEILNLHLESPSQHELEKALTTLETDEIFMAETVDGMARKLGMYELLFDKPDYFEAYLNQLSKVQTSDILRISRKYLVTPRLTTAALVEKERAKVKKIIAAFESNFSQAIKDISKIDPQDIGQKHKKQIKTKFHTQSSRDDVIKYKSKRGAKIIFRVDKQVPTVSVKVAFRGGQRQEPAGKYGLSELFSSCWMAGTQKHSEAELLHTMENLGITIRPFAGRNSHGLGMSCLSERLDAGLDLLDEILCAPKFHAVEREKKVLIEAIRQRQDNPASVAMQGFHRLMFGTHPYARDILGDEKTMGGITKQDVEDFWRKTVNANNTTLVLVGDAPTEKCKIRLEQIFSKLQTGEKIEDHFSLSELNQNIHEFEKTEKEQAHIVYGTQALNAFDPRRAALEVMESVLSGQGGRLFLELRDKASLAYSVSPIKMLGLDAGFFGAYIGCSPEKAKTAIEMLDQQFKRIAEEKVSADELARAQRYLIGRHDIGLQRNSALASEMLFEEIYDKSYEEVFKYAERIRGVTVEQVQSLAQELYKRPKVIFAAGKEQPW